MASNINGTGTTFRGKRDFLSDGTYITTEWFTIFFLPIIPLRSLRVRENPNIASPDDVWFSNVIHSKTYEVCERTTINWKQVIYTYCYFIILCSWVNLIHRFIMPFLTGKPYSENTTYGPLLISLEFLMCAPAIFLPYFLRRHALKKIHETSKHLLN